MQHKATDSLSLEEISEILDLYEAGETPSSIAKELEIPLETIQDIVTMGALEDDSEDVFDTDSDEIPISEAEWFRWNSPKYLMD